MPGQPEASIVTVTLEELQAVPSHSQFMLINNTQQQFDDYVTYTGIKIKDLLDAQTVPPTDVLLRLGHGDPGS
jgi:hypothetical protein